MFTRIIMEIYTLKVYEFGSMETLALGMDLEVFMNSLGSSVMNMDSYGRRTGLVN